MQTLVSSPSNLATHAGDRVAGKAQRRNKIIYWALTLVMFLPATAGAFVELFTSGPASIVNIMLALGFPVYLMKILGFAKILGGIAILTGKLPRMKEWAYAGFTFDFLGATASHVLAGDGAHALFPLVFFLFMAVSYFLWHKTSATPLPFSRSAEESTTQLIPDNGQLTLINTYNVKPERADELVEFLTHATQETLRYVPGFISAKLHLSFDRTKVVNYAQWTNAEATAAARQDPRVSELMRQQLQIAEDFNPVPFRLRSSLARIRS